MVLRKLLKNKVDIYLPNYTTNILFSYAVHIQNKNYNDLENLYTYTNDIL